MAELLTPIDYEKIAKKLFHFQDKAGLIKFLEKEYEYYSRRNKKFWGLLFEAFDRISAPFITEENKHSRILDDLKEKEQFDSEDHKYVFIRDLLSKEVEQYLASRKLDQRKFNLKDVVQIEQRILKISEVKGIRVRFYASEFNALLDTLLDLTYFGNFHITDIKDDLSKESLSTLIKYYFAVEVPEEKSLTNVVLTGTNKFGEGIAYKSVLPTSISTDANLIFIRAHEAHSQRNQSKKPDFKAFQDYEIRRWKTVLKHFDEFDREYQLITRYLYHVSRLVKKKLEKYINEKFSFGIDKNQHFDSLYQLLFNLTEKVDLILTTSTVKAKTTNNQGYYERLTQKKQILTDTTSLLTSNNYKESNVKVYFGCETTTVAYVLDLINKKFSYGNGLNPYAIERSQSFFISPLKKPSEKAQVDISKFKPLLRSNLVHSLRRFNEYKKDKNKTEYKHLQSIEFLMK